MKILAVALAFAAALVIYWMYSRTFTPSHWAGHNDPGNMDNPRRKMVPDLLAHHLRPGMPRDSVLRLLGPPKSEGLQRRLSYGPWPDALQGHAQHLSVDSINQLVRASPLDTVLSYPIGWATIDALSLTIRLDHRARLVSARVVQH